MHGIRAFCLLHPLLGNLRWKDVTSGSLLVTWGHVTSVPVMWLPPPVSYSFVGSETRSIRQFSAFYSHFQVTSGQRTTSGSVPVTWGRDIISCHVPASSSELQPCRKWNAQYTWVFASYSHFQVTSGQMTSLLGHFRSPGHVTSFPVMWLPTPAIYSLVRSETFCIREVSTFYSHFQVTSGQMTLLPGRFWSPEVTWRHFLSRDCLLLRATAL